MAFINYIEEQFFPKSEIKLYHNNFLASPCGTGKTTALRGWLEDNPDLTVIVVTFRVSLAYMLSQAYGFENYLDFKHESSFSLAQHPRLVVSVESLQKFFRSQVSGSVEFELPDVLVLDEYCSIIEHAFNVKTLDPSRRSLFFTFLFTMLKSQTRTVIGADAFFDLDMDVDVFKSLHETDDLASLQYNIVVNNYRKKVRFIRIWQSAKHWKNYLLVTAKEAKKKIFFFVNNKTVSDAIHAELVLLKGKVAVETSYPTSSASDCLYLSSDSSPGDLMKSSIDPNSEWKNYNFVTVTPTIQAGVSFDLADHFDLGFGYAGLGSTQPLGVLQQLARVRNYTEDRIELCVQKQTRGSISRAPPSIEDVKSILEKRVDGFNCRYLRCCEVNYTLNEDENVIRFGLNPKSIVNIFCIRVARADYFARSNYLTALTVLAEKDSYNVSVMHARECKRFTEKVVREHKRLGRQDLTEAEFDFQEEAIQNGRKRDLPSFQSSFPCTLQKHSVFKSEILLNEWDGVFRDDDKITDAKSFVKLKKFIKDWNILGGLGGVNELISIDETFTLRFQDIVNGEEVIKTMESEYPPACANLISFNQEHVGEFYARFVADEKQERFHEYVTGNYKKMIQSGRAELNVGNQLNVSEAITFEFCVELWSLMGVCPMEKIVIKNWLGADIERNPVMTFRMNENELHDALADSVKTQPYVEDIPVITKACDSAFTLLDETRLCNIEIAEDVRKLFKLYWEHIYTTIVDASNGCATRECPRVIDTPCQQQTVSETLDFLKLVGETTRESFRYIGLRYNQSTKSTVRTASIWHHAGRRVRLNKFVIENFTERLMISYCRVVKDAGMRVHSMAHYPRPDPFNLLFFDPMSKAPHNVRHSIQFGYRFKRILWASGPSPNPWIQKDLATWATYDKPEIISRARELGLIESHSTIMETILPTLRNVRYYWYLFRIGRENPIPLRTSLYAKLLTKSEEYEWTRTHTQDKGLDLETEKYEQLWWQTDIFKTTGLLRYVLFGKTDEEIRDCIEKKDPRNKKQIVLI
jgi:hypothetical protein